MSATLDEKAQACHNNMLIRNVETIKSLASRLQRVHPFPAQLRSDIPSLSIMETQPTPSHFPSGRGTYPTTANGTRYVSEPAWLSTSLEDAETVESQRVQHVYVKYGMYCTNRYVTLCFLFLFLFGYFDFL